MQIDTFPLAQTYFLPELTAKELPGSQEAERKLPALHWILSPVR